MNERLKVLDMESMLKYFMAKKPDFAAAIKPSGEEEIHELEMLVGKKLPAEYKTFLKYMGHSTGMLFPKYGLLHARNADGSMRTEKRELSYDFTIDSIRKFYIPTRAGKSARKSKLLSKYRDFILIGIQHHSQDGGYYYIDCREKDKFPIVNIDEYGEIHELAPSLRDLILRYAFQETGELG